MRALSVALVLLLIGCASTTPTPTVDVVTPAPPSPTSSPSPTSQSSPTTAATSTASPGDELTDEALRIVRSDARVDEFLDRNPFQVDRVAIDSDTLHLLLTLDGPISGPAFWTVTCSAGFTAGEITGLHFVIDAAARSVVAFSPRWGENSCAPLPDTD